MARAHRCPFCHDAIPWDTPDRVMCAGCGAAHHADCFVEHGGCATTACGTTTARVGKTETPVAGLAALLQEPERFKVLAEGSRGDDSGLGLLWHAIGLALFMSPGLYLGAEAGAVGLFVWLVLFGASKALGSEKRPMRVGVGGIDRLEQRYNEITGQWEPSAWELVSARLAQGARPEGLRRRASGPSPAECPHCEQALHDGDEHEEADLGFCFHCGADLEPATPWFPEGEDRPPAEGLKA